MWQLHMTGSGGDWVLVDTFGSVTEAARQIREIEGYPVVGVFLEVYVCTEHGSDNEAFAHLEHKGRKAAYVIKRRVN
jgi:hypothetical protein